MTAQATTPLGVTELITILAQLGRSVTGAAGAPPELTAVHLTRVLVAAAEQQAIAAELAAAKTHGGVLPSDAEVNQHQGTYDLATATGTLSLLAVCHWRSQRLAAGVQATAEAFTDADRGQEPESSPLTRMWDLAAAAAAVPEALFGVLAGVTIDDADADTVQAARCRHRPAGARG
jgi:hypothetical protein